MSRLSIKTFATVAVAAMIFSLSAGAFAAQATSVQSAPSATFTLSANPNIVSPGGTTMITGTIQNTSSDVERLTISYEVEGPCGYYQVAKVGVTLKPGETRTASVSYTVPNCAGTYTITGTVTSGKAFVTSATTTITVQ
ncbi:MAG: sporulation protein [Acidobacteria bacterium]|nr:sporulation protein [Acidobacteriota bacterium]